MVACALRKGAIKRRLVGLKTALPQVARRFRVLPPLKGEDALTLLAASKASTKKHKLRSPTRPG